MLSVKAMVKILLFDKFGKKKGLMPVARDRVLIHDHLFKNAGTTIDWVLRRNFGSAFVDHREDDLMKSGKDYLGTYLRENKHILAISSHHITLPLPELRGLNLTLLKMFRHPLARVLSVYNFERKQPEPTPGAQMAKRVDFCTYLDWRLSSGSPGVLRNFHVRRLLPGEFRRRDIDNGLFAQAIEALEQLECFGIVESFDASMVLFEAVLKPSFPRIDFAYKAQNVERGLERSIEKDLAELEARAGRDRFERLVDANRYDLEIYEIAKKQFRRRIEEIENLELKLSDFRERCRLVAGKGGVAK